MPKLDVVAILKLQHKEAKATVNRLDDAIRVLERLGNKGPGRRTMSLAGRKRIAAAQRKRWAKLRLVKKR
jgi:negative regulator of replication initiation